MKPRIYQLVERSRHPYPWRASHSVELSCSRHAIGEAARKLQLKNPGREYALATIGDDGECCRIDQADRVCQLCGSIESTGRFEGCSECS